jgi:hypothetical protein
MQLLNPTFQKKSIPDSAPCPIIEATIAAEVARRWIRLHRSISATQYDAQQHNAEHDAGNLIFGWQQGAAWPHPSFVKQCQF